MATTLSLLRFAPLPPRLSRSSLSVGLTPSSLSVNLTPAPTQSARVRRRAPPISASYHTVSSVERVISILSYTLPLFNSLPYGRLLQAQYPLVASLTSPFSPMLALYSRAPQLGFIGFLVLYISLARNPSMSRYVRFNAMQAVVLDVMLALPPLVQRIFGTPSGRTGIRILQLGYGAIFVFGFATFLYCSFNCLVGRTPFLPYVSNAADRQL